MYAEDKFAEQRYGQPETAEVKQPQVHESIHELERLIEQHMKTAAEIEQRLTPILRNEPQAAGGNKQDASSAVPLAGRINESVAKLNSILDCYRSILRRIEV